MTRILAIETSLRTGSAALLEHGAVVASRMLSSEMRSAQSLAPAVKELLEKQGWSPRSLRAVGVTIGPGSFTGVRVGVAFAKVFCYAAKLPIIGLTTLETIARQATRCAAEIHVLLDAQRGELFHQAFSRQDERLTAIAEPTVVSAEKWIEMAAARTDVLATGAGLAKIRPMLPGSLLLEPAEHWEPKATTVTLLADQALKAGRRDDLGKIAPLYLRASAAEEKRENI